MHRDILLILLGLVIGIAVPNLSAMANALLSGNGELFMEALRIALLSFVIEGILIIIIIFMLRKEYRKDSKRDEDNTKKIVSAIKELGSKIDNMGVRIYGKPDSTKPEG